ncbi:MAG: hypothetical protein HKO53_10485 [Gemmatimonadetes bacterium]|nr:hypothetical protein [Gemmatimonadota bacterium]
MVLDDSVMARNDALREMMRFARAIVADGSVSDEEAKGLRAWIEANPHVRGLPAVDDILGILTNALDDGTLTEAEREELSSLLERFGG